MEDKQMIETKFDNLFRKIQNNNLRKLTTKVIETENLSAAISLYIDVTKKLGIDFDDDNSTAPFIYCHNDDDDIEEQFFIEHINFTDSGELADVTLKAINGSGICFTMPGDVFLGLKENDLDEISSYIYYRIKEICGIE